MYRVQGVEGAGCIGCRVYRVQGVEAVWRGAERVADAGLRSRA